MQTFKLVVDMLQLLCKTLQQFVNYLGNTLYEVRLNQTLKFGVNFPTGCTVSANDIMEEVV